MVRTMNKLTITKKMIKTSRAIISFRNIAHISWKIADRRKNVKKDELFYDVRIYSNADAIRQMMNEEEFIELTTNYTNWVNTNE